VVNSALTKELEGYIVKDCNDVNKTDGVIILNKAKENKVVNKEGCIIVNGITEEDIIKGADRLVFDLLNVIK